MAERTLLTERIQLGIEGTPGVAATVNRRLLSAMVDFGPAGEVDAFRPAGSKFPALSVLGKEWSEGGLEGKPTYDEMLFWIALNLGAPQATTTPATGTLSRQHVWDIAAQDVQEPKTATMERGSSVRAHRTLFTFLQSLGLEYSRSAIDLNGDLMARQIEDGITMTALDEDDDLPLIPILPKDTSVYLDSTVGGLGGTKLLRALEASWALGDRLGTVWPLNDALDSFAAVYETEPSGEVDLTLEADAAGMALLTQMRSGASKYLRIETVGPIIETTIPYKLTVDLHVKHRDVGAFGDEDDLMTIDWPLGMFIDGSWAGETYTGIAGQITLVNTQTGL